MTLPLASLDQCRSSEAIPALCQHSRVYNGYWASSLPFLCMHTQVNMYLILLHLVYI